MSDNDVLSAKLDALTARVTRMEENQSRVVWVFLAAAAALFFEPIKSIVTGGGL